MKSKTILLILIAAFFITCKKNKIPDYAAQAVCTGTTPTYTNNIASILNANCATSGCHNASSSKAGINLSDYASAKSEFQNNNKNLAAVHHDKSVKAMPQGASQLTSDVINQLDCWVKNSCPQ